MGKKKDYFNEYGWVRASNQQLFPYGKRIIIFNFPKMALMATGWNEHMNKHTFSPKSEHKEQKTAYGAERKE